MHLRETQNVHTFRAIARPWFWFPLIKNGTKPFQMQETQFEGRVNRENNSEIAEIMRKVPFQNKER